jgi:rod shape-determining protein MreC
MQKRGNVVPIFIGFFILSLLIFLFFSKGIAGLLEQLTVPLQKSMFASLHKPGENKTETEKLREENSRLLTELAHQNELEKENKALKDQFNTPDISSHKLLSADVIRTENDEIIINRGSSDGVKKGGIVIVKNSLIGRVVEVSAHISVVNLVTHGDILFTAQASKTQALGVINGRGGGMIFGNVILSEVLDKGDLVMTKGDINKDGSGYPPHLIVGKITSVNKRASNLFQVAQVQSLIDLSRLSVVFVMIP